jgi:hypothetical protein
VRQLRHIGDDAAMYSPKCRAWAGLSELAWCIYWRERKRTWPGWIWLGWSRRAERALVTAAV